MTQRPVSALRSWAASLACVAGRFGPMLQFPCSGASRGIGRAIAEALAQQGLNVVVQGLEPELTPAIKELQTRYASQQFVGVACSFAPGGDYLQKIKDATAGKDIQLVFNNAGFIVTGFFDSQPLGKHLVNMECNATAAVAITHHFASLMVNCW